MAVTMIPLMLILLGRVAPRSALGRRFYGALAVTTAFWLFLLIVRYPTLRQLTVVFPDVVAGSLFYVTAVTGIFSAWSLLAYGYTVSVLDAAASFDGSFDRERWLRRYGGGRGLEGFFEDRLRVLLGFRLIKVSDSDVGLRGRCAKSFGKLVLCGMKWFHVPGFPK